MPPPNPAPDEAVERVFTCNHCGRSVSWDDGAYDVIERCIGPICDDCAALWEPCTTCVNGWVGVAPDQIEDGEVGNCVDCDGLGVVEAIPGGGSFG